MLLAFIVEIDYRLCKGNLEPYLFFGCKQQRTQVSFAKVLTSAMQFSCHAMLLARELLNK